MLKIDLGAGNNPRPGFESLNDTNIQGTRYTEDYRKLPFENDSIEALNASHILEKYSWNDMDAAIKEWNRVLKPGSCLTVTTTNMVHLAESYLSLDAFDKNTEGKLKYLKEIFGYNNQTERKFSFDFWLLGELLLKAGFYKVDLLTDIHAEELTVKALKPVNLDNKITYKKQDRPPRILVESTARVFGDSLLSYPLTAIFKAKYPGSHISYAAGKIEKPLFEIAETIDQVTEKTIDNPSVPLNDKDYDIILRAPFDVDEKWKPEKYIDGFDGPDGWDRVEKAGVHLKFNYPQSKLDEINNTLAPYKDKKKVMMFIPSPRPNMSIPWEISGWDVENYQRMVDELNGYRDDLVFFTFYGFQEKHKQLVTAPNVVDLGKIYAYDEVLWFMNIDLLVSTSTSVSAMIAPLVETPQVVIHTCEHDETPVWHGIPDKCVLPPLRLLYLCSQKTTGEVISFVKPEAGGKTWNWNFNNYFEGKTIPRKMRVSHDVRPETVAEEVNRRLNNPHAPGKEWFIPQGEKVCNYCRLLKKYGRCVYGFTPRLRNGKMLGEETDSVILADKQAKILEKVEAGSL